MERFEPTNPIPARVALLACGSCVVDIAEQVTLSAPQNAFDGPATVYLQGAREGIATLKAKIAVVEAYLTAAEASAADIDARTAVALKRMRARA